MENSGNPIPSSPVPHVYVIIVNWNGWGNTVECLESVFRLRHTDYTVVVCDNASSDDSVSRISAWARGELKIAHRSGALARLVEPPISKPIAYAEYSNLESAVRDRTQASLVLIRSGTNRGFGAGNNIGLRYAISRDNCGYAWLLNNDTVVHPTSLSALIARFRESRRVGICGSRVLLYDHPTTIQALGGASYNRYLARVKHLGGWTKADEVSSVAAIEERLSYVFGASMLVSREFLSVIGLMSESYYLYFEELDWATRAKGRYSLAYSDDSIVYHKGGSATGTTPKSRRSDISEFYATRNRILFTRSFHAKALPSVYGAVLISAVERLVTGKFSNFKAVLRGAASGTVSPRAIPG